MLKRYGEELQSVFDELIRMASYAVGAVRKAQAALERGDAAAAKNIVEGDENVNRFEKEIEQRALRIIIKYQPVANDLRDVTGALKMITDIERIGDQAADIASVFLKIGEAVRDDDLSAMFAHVADMATAAVNAFVNGDRKLAEKTIALDDRSDEMFASIKDKMCERLKSRPEEAEKIIYIMMIAKYLERIGDHAVNICEWAVFVKTGVYKGSEIM
ncbi:MAG TPA: phosphate signaling complex protein PhoU [Candidatus Ornithoclostridium faecigallinarum]|nr:phosphate signaling complex protein PhoU [Candidatus Ornithoclostridium faecigallinarum]